MSKFVTLDTNIFVSYFTRRNEQQFNQAEILINQLRASQIEVFLPTLIVGEIFYILLKVYEFQKLQTCEAVQTLIDLSGLITDDKDVLLFAIENYSTKNLDFADCYLLAIDELKKYKLITFDKKLKNQSL